jgi:multidrug efflux pump subunit AcrA (membrane-fusion protein)
MPHAVRHAVTVNAMQLHREGTMKSGVIGVTITLVVIALFASACSPSAPAAQPTSTAAAESDTSGVTAEGRIEPVRYADLALSADGSVSELLVTEGQEVEAGQVIARIKNSNPQTLETAQAEAAKRLAAAYQDAHDAQDALDNFDIPAKFAGMTAAQGARQALENLNIARDNFEPYKGDSHKGYRRNKYFPSLPRHILVDFGTYTGLAKEYDKRVESAWVDYRRAVMWLEFQSALETAQAQVLQAQKDLDSLQDPALAEDTAGARAALASAELRAPFTGTITNLDLKVGELAASGKAVVTIADFSSWVVKTTDLTEIDVVNIKEGQPVTLTLDAIPGASLKGYVMAIGQNYAEKQGDIVYKVTVLLTDSYPGMRWGMTTQIHFPD